MIVLGKRYRMRIKHGVRELWKGSKKEEEFVGTTLVVVHRPVRAFYF
jgi:hypothetical protein